MSTKTTLPTLTVLLGSLSAACGVSAEDPSSSTLQTVSAAQCAAADGWAEWKPYAVGDVVTYGNATFACRQAHTSEPGWTPAAALALWSSVTCEGGGVGGGASSGGTSGPAPRGGGGAAASCDASAWVQMTRDPDACAGHLGESCGWTPTNLNQGYHCQTTSWGAGCEAGGATCGGGSGTGTSSPGTGGTDGTGGTGSGGTGAGGTGTTGGTGTGGTGTGGTASGFVFGPYKDTTIHMNWNTNVISTMVSGASTPFAADLTANGGKSVTLAFATGECGAENWGGVPGAAMAAANVAALGQAGVRYMLSTGGAAGSFTCGSDTGMAAFIDHWVSPGLIGVDFDIEAGQSQPVIAALLERIKAAHARYTGLRFSLTLATLANNDGASTARSMGAAAPDSFNSYGDWTMGAVKSSFGFDGTKGTWPSYLTVNLMTMDFGSATPGVCVVSGGTCQMGQSAIQAAYNLHDKWGVPYSNIELTPMIGGNDVSGETFSLADADTVARFASSAGLAGVHYWSYDRDVDCPPGSASATCNSMGGAGAHGFMKRFQAAGLK